MRNARITFSRLPGPGWHRRTRTLNKKGASARTICHQHLQEFYILLVRNLGRKTGLEEATLVLKKKNSDF